MNVDAVEAGFLPGLDRVAPCSPQRILRNHNPFEPQEAAEIELRGLFGISILAARMPVLYTPHFAERSKLFVRVSSPSSGISGIADAIAQERLPLPIHVRHFTRALIRKPFMNRRELPSDFRPAQNGVRI